MSPVLWLGIEIRHLVALAAVAQTGSFRGAADELGYVQSAISQQIAQLERLVNKRLVERSRGAKHVHLTPAGEVLLQHIDEIVGRFRAAQADVAAIRDLGRSEIRVGFFGGLANRLLSPLLHRLAVDSPATTLIPVDASTDEALFARLEEGTLDLAFVERPVVPGPFEHRDLQADPWILLAQAGSPVARSAKPPSPEELARLPMIGLSGSRSHARAQTWLTERGHAPRIVASAENASTVQSFVRSGLGVAVMPRLAVDVDDAQVSVIELSDMLPARSLALCWLRERRHLHEIRRLCTIANAVTRDMMPTVDHHDSTADRPVDSLAA